jgi:hypothetical protein
VRVGPAGDGDGRDRRARFLRATPEMEAAHQRFRERLGGMRAAPKRTQASMRQVVFSASRDHEVAFETSGHGDFTVRATRVLAAGVAGLTHEGFQARVDAAFGDGARQHPELDCHPSARTRPLLAPVAAASGMAAAVTGNGRGVATGGGAPASTIAVTLRALADALEARP